MSNPFNRISEIRGELKTYLKRDCDVISSVLNHKGYYKTAIQLDLEEMDIACLKRRDFELTEQKVVWKLGEESGESSYIVIENLLGNNDDFWFANYGNDFADNFEMFKEIIAFHIFPDFVKNALDNKDELSESDFTVFHTQSGVSIYEEKLEELMFNIKLARNIVSMADVSDMIQNRQGDALVSSVFNSWEETGRQQNFFNYWENNTLLANEDIKIAFESGSTVVAGCKTEGQYGDYYKGWLFDYSNSSDRIVNEIVGSVDSLMEEDNMSREDIFEEVCDYDEIITDSQNLDKNVTYATDDRNLSIKRLKNFDEVVEEEVEDAKRFELRDKVDKEEREEVPVVSDILEHDIARISYNVDEVRLTASDTESVKQVQEDFGIEEEEVRAIQDDWDWDRLTAQRRANIVSSLLEERIYEGIQKYYNIDFDEVREDTISKIKTVGEAECTFAGRTVFSMQKVSQESNIRLGTRSNVGRPIKVLFPYQTTIKASLFNMQEDISFTLPKGEYKIMSPRRQ